VAACVRPAHTRTTLLTRGALRPPARIQACKPVASSIYRGTIILHLLPWCGPALASCFLSVTSFTSCATGVHPTYAFDCSYSGCRTATAACSLVFMYLNFMRMCKQRSPSRTLVVRMYLTTQQFRLLTFSDVQTSWAAQNLLFLY
jgi:hypothetical protein